VLHSHAIGRKANPAGALIDFDRVYAELTAPAVTDADLEPLRADEETWRDHPQAHVRALILCPTPSPT